MLLVIVFKGLDIFLELLVVEFLPEKMKKFRFGLDLLSKCIIGKCGIPFKTDRLKFELAPLLDGEFKNDSGIGLLGLAPFDTDLGETLRTVESFEFFLKVFYQIRFEEKRFTRLEADFRIEAFFLVLGVSAVTNI